MRLFRLERNKDITGISGTGIVAQGCEFSDRRVALCWQTETPTVVLQESLEAVELVHGHNSSTVVRFYPLLEPAVTEVKCFFLNHRENKYGLTREGTVAECAVFENGWVAMRWLVEPHSIEVHPTYEGWMHIHASQSHTYLSNFPGNIRRGNWVDLFLSNFRWYRDLTGGDWYQVRGRTLQDRPVAWARMFCRLCEDVLDIEAR